MSTYGTYQLSAAEQEARRRAEEAATQRRLELRRLQTEQAAAVHRETLALASRYERQSAATLRHQGQALAAADAQVTQGTKDMARMGTDLRAIESRLAASERDLSLARRELEVEMGRVAALSAAVGAEQTKLGETLRQAEATLGWAGKVAAANQAQAEELGREAVASDALLSQQGGLEARIRQLDAELRLLTQREDLAPAALITLEAMTANGYRLVETATAGELIVYFRKESADHHLAVRLAKVSRPGENLDRWDLLAETFGLGDETCLAELEDFESGIEEVGWTRLQATGEPVYPKDDRSPTRRGALPAPSSRAGRRSAGSTESQKQST